MNKKQLIAAIAVLSTALEIESVTDGLEVKELEALHTKLTEEKEAREQNENKDDVKIKTQENVVLQFVRPYKRYSNKDVAGFNADTAESILKLKPPVAVKYQEETTEE
jgi:hypothetical protein